MENDSPPSVVNLPHYARDELALVLGKRFTKYIPAPTRAIPIHTIVVTGSDKRTAPKTVPKRGAKKVNAVSTLTEKRLIIQNHST